MALIQADDYSSFVRPNGEPSPRSLRSQAAEQDAQQILDVLQTANVARVDLSQETEARVYARSLIRAVKRLALVSPGGVVLHRLQRQGQVLWFYRPRPEDLTQYERRQEHGRHLSAARAAKRSMVATG